MGAHIMKPLMKFFVLYLILGSIQVQAAFIKVDISSIVNSDLHDYTSGLNYPAPGIVNIGGTPFELADGGNGHAWVAGGLQAASSVYTLGGLNISNAVTMHALINSAWGTCGQDVGTLEASGGSSTSFTLTEGKNVRDHFQGGFCNTVTDAVATANYPGGIRFDAYSFDVSSISGPLTSVKFTNFGQGVSNGSPFLAALTVEVSSAPEPTTLALMSLGLAGIGYRRHRSKTAA